MKKVKLKETRVFGISCERDSHPMDDKTFMDIAEEEGNVWSMKGFQDKFNCRGEHINTNGLDWERFSYLQIRFIDVEIRNFDQSTLNTIANFIIDNPDPKDEIIWLLKNVYQIIKYHTIEYYLKNLTIL